jgi:hypothetical protein
MNPGEAALHDLRRRPAFKVYAPINSLNFYIPRRCLDACADDADGGQIGDLNFTPGIGVTDKSWQPWATRCFPLLIAPIRSTSSLSIT